MIATLDNQQFIVRDNLYTIISTDSTLSLKYVLALLNSTFLTWCYQNIINPEKGEALAQVKRGHLAKLPIKTLHLTDKSEKKQHDEIIKQVDLLLKLNEQLKNEQDKTKQKTLTGRIAFAEQRIDELVYEIYGLTEEEIRIVEGN